MIDLRSDTLSMPDKAMLETIMSAPLGDDGRLDENGRGEDPTINRLEDMAAKITGKEEGLLCCSGTMGNQVALMTWCQPGERVLLDELQHLYYSEKTEFTEQFSHLRTVFYHLDDSFMPDIANMEEHLKSQDIKLICVENTHNFTGGTCIDAKRLSQIYELAHMYHVPVHMDGARLFNAADYLKTTAKELCQYVDSVQFCLSKGLGAPVGSVLCGTKEFIRRAKASRKLMGGALRQGGIIAAPGIYALKHNIQRLHEDNEHARICALHMTGLKRIKVQKEVQTNIVMLDVTDAGMTPQEFCQKAKEKGLWIRPVLTHDVRLVFYKGITETDAVKAARIICELDQEIK